MPEPDSRGSETTDGGSGGDGDRRLDRQTLVRLLIVLGVGIPIVIEGVSLVGLVGQHVDEPAGDGGAGTIDTDGFEAVRVGADLLPETDQTERIQRMEIDATGDWTFRFGVNVTNPGPPGYRLTLDSVTTRDGKTIQRAIETPVMEPGDSVQLDTAWSLPEGQLPQSITVTATVPTANGTQTIRREVTLNEVPVHG